MKAGLGVALAIAAAALTASCGVKTGLVRPAPMWGDARAEYLAEQARQQTEPQSGAPAPSVAPPPPPYAPAIDSPIAPSLPPG